MPLWTITAPQPDEPSGDIGSVPRRRRNSDGSDLRSVLRRATRGSHGRVEALYDALDFTRRCDYSRFLFAHALALETVETAVRSDAPRLGFPPSLSDLAVFDLRLLGVVPPEPGGLGRPAGQDACGMMYVVAGSHLGNRVLGQRWRRSIDPAVRSAGAYLSNTRMSAYWPKFLGILDAQQRRGVAVDAMVDAAGFAFGLFEQAYYRATLSLKAGPDV